MWEVGDVGEESIVSVRAQANEVHAEGLPEVLDECQGLSAGTASGSGDADAILEEVGSGEFDAAFFGTCHGMTADEMDFSGEDLVSECDDGAFCASDIRYDRSRR